MFRQSPGRNQRSKGIKVKHVLQLCFLIAICFWLIYQVKHSHDKKKEFDESDSKISVRTQTSSEIIMPKLGRKDLKPEVDEIATTTKKKNEEAEEEEESVGGEEEENKQEGEQKFDEDKEDESKGVGEDELPENELEKSEPEVDQEEETTEDKEEVDEKESEENDPEDDNGQLDNESSLDDHDDEDGTAKSTHEAREELYKADDASSAVTHEAQIAADEETENDDSEIDKSANEDQANSTVKPSIDENTSHPKTQEREMIENNHPLDTISNNVAADNVESKPEKSSLVVQADDHAQNTTEVIRVANSTNVADPRDNDQSDKSTLSSGNHQEESVKTEEMNSSSETTTSPDNRTLPIMSEKSMNTSVVREDNNSQSSSTTGNDNTTDSENLLDNNSKETDAVKTENQEVQNDPIDSSDSAVAVRTDLETLPEIQTEATNDEDAAAE